MATVPPAKRSRESDDEDDVHDSLVDPALVGESPKRKRGRPPGSGKKKDTPGIGDPADATATGAEATTGDATTATGEPAPAPIKTPEEIAAEEAKKNRPPAKRGRPRKRPKTDEGEVPPADPNAVTA
ncbi:hypothetical protein CPB86DRAFT_811374 [Serendipita vermifera]|nr:hypothetical protein CPB86DRAFT_811374 [Serendipita vermifera]